MSDPILNSDEWGRMFATFCRGDLAESFFSYEDRLRAHDAALRSRLAEVEAERDEAVRRSALDEAQCDHMTDTAGRLAVELTAAEARLAEAIELLRGLTDMHPISPAGAGARIAARAFIEAHGEAG